MIPMDKTYVRICPRFEISEYTTKTGDVGMGFSESPHVHCRAYGRNAEDYNGQFRDLNRHPIDWLIGQGFEFVSDNILLLTS